MVEIHAPTEFSLAVACDKLGDLDEALEHYQTFYSIYKDCDPFYQHNVQHAKSRIEEIERMQLRPK